MLLNPPFRRACLLALLLTVIPGHVRAQDNGREFLTQCNAAVRVLDGKGKELTPAQREGAMYCMGYVRGITKIVTIGYYLKPIGQLFCPPPEGIATGRAVRLLVDYMNDHPDRLHASKVTLSAAAFMRAWPCPEPE